MIRRVAALQPAQRSVAIALLTDAFADDCGMLSIVGRRSPAHTRRMLAVWFRATLDTWTHVVQPSWVVTEDDQPVGIALAATSDASWSGMVWLRWLAVVGMQGSLPMVWQTMRQDQARAAYRPAQVHVVLEFLAVRSDRRGQGYGALLLAALHQWSDAQSAYVGVWLETTRTERVPWFRQQGYAVTHQLTDACGRQRYAMYRARGIGDTDAAS